LIPGLVQWVKGSGLLQGMGLQLWLEFSPWPGNFHMPSMQPFKKKLCNFVPTGVSVSMLCFQMQGLNLAAGVEGMNAFIMISYSCGRRQVSA
jgi:hypothetical protein